MWVAFCDGSEKVFHLTVVVQAVMLRHMQIRFALGTMPLLSSCISEQNSSGPCIYEPYLLPVIHDHKV
jgi:hypothetical protein